MDMGFKGFYQLLQFFVNPLLLLFLFCYLPLPFQLENVQFFLFMF